MNFLLAGVGSTLPATSTARTLKTCLPGFSFLYVFGDLHRLNDFLSSLHSKLEPFSLEENLNLAVVAWILALGPLVILV